MRVGFAVIYRWRLHEGKEQQFARGWETITLRLMADRGALGSRLHRAEDGTWYAYAQWPSKKIWQRSRKITSPDLEATKQMQDAVEHSYDAIPMTPVSDHLS